MIWSAAFHILQLVPSETGALTLCSPNYYFFFNFSSRGPA